MQYVVYKDKEKEREKNKRWYRNNIEKDKEEGRRWYQANRERKLETSKEWYQDNRGKRLIQNKIYQAKDRLKYRYYTTKCFEIKKYGEFNVTEEEYKAKFISEICGFCGRPFNGKRKVWEHHYEQFWHSHCNGFKSNLNKEEFKKFISDILTRI